MSIQVPEGEAVWPMKMSSALNPSSVLRLLLFLAECKIWVIALHSTGRPAAQPLTHAITEDRETKTENCNNALKFNTEIVRNLITTERLQLSNL